MTIRVTIKNEDTGANRVIGARQTNLDGTEIPGCPVRELQAQESTELYVHDGNQIVIREIKNG